MIFPYSTTRRFRPKTKSSSITILFGLLGLGCFSFDFLFTFDRIRSLAPLHPEWQTVEPYKSILARDTTSIIRNMTSEMIAKIMAITHSGMTTEVFGQIVKEWLDHAVDPRFKKHYTELVYKPMIEVVDLLKKNEFSVYIVSGGSQDFIRVYSEKVYRVPPENVIGTTGKTRYEYIDGQPVLMKLPEVLFIDNMKGKPESINLFIGRLTKHFSSFQGRKLVFKHIDICSCIAPPRFSYSKLNHVHSY